jgi:hypothetical protein
MITKEDLIKAGFVPFPSAKDKTYVKDALQKAVRGEDYKKLYFITVYLWDFPEAWLPAEAKANLAVSVEVRMFTQKDGKEVSFDLNAHPDKDWTIEQLEDFYAFAYKNLCCVPDIHNN